jgi:hypothetical protein
MDSIRLLAILPDCIRWLHAHLDGTLKFTVSKVKNVSDRCTTTTTKSSLGGRS